jgi:hypothetical protein
MSDETTALLIRARGFLVRGWCRGALAIDDDGKIVDPKSERAVAWCADGALVAAGLGPDRRSHPAMRRLLATIDCRDIGIFNNRQETVEPVLAAFDRAIAAEPT